MKLIKLLTLLLFFPTTCLVAQNATSLQERYLDSLIVRAGNVYKTHNYKEAITISAKLIEKGNEYNISYPKFYGYDLLGVTYKRLDDSIKARINAEKALEIAEESEIDSLIALEYKNLGSILTSNGRTYEKGLGLLQNSISIYENNNKPRYIYGVYINIIWTLLDNERQEEAYEYLNKANSIAEKVDVPEEDEMCIKFLMGRYYHRAKYFYLAEQQLLPVSEQLEKGGLNDLGVEVYKSLKEIYKEQRNYKKALSSSEKEKYYREKVYASKKIQAIEVASAKFELSEYQKDLEIAIKEKEHSKELVEASQQLVDKSEQLTYIFIVATSVLLLALLGFYLLFRSRKKFIKKLSRNNIELVEARDKTEKLSKVKSQFFSTVSHELRTPLYGVIGISSMLQEDIKLKSHQKELNSLKFSADYLLALINDVLLLNKMDYQDLVLEKVPFRLDALIGSITRSFEYSLEQNKNKLIVDIDKEIPNNLIGSSVRLSQILMNLIGNATKFNENGTIWFNIKLKEVTQDGSYRTHFVIKDDGIGIPKDKQAFIFEEFTQVEDENYNHKGTGLGLPIAKKLLKLHNSDIHLKSELGKGSEFSFTLDLIENENQSQVSASQSHTVEDVSGSLMSQYGNIHVLIVDDNKINQKVTQRMLDKNGIKFSVANDGDEAITMALFGTYDLILMDINMPKVNGIEATKKIREFNKHIPIIALTAVEVEEMRIEILESGMDAILSKPYESLHFLTTILRVLSKKRSRVVT